MAPATPPPPPPPRDTERCPPPSEDRMHVAFAALLPAWRAAEVAA